ncbi:MAG TPA: Rne/Rng family ribonuclease [Micromonosporaceae bacterium]|nr:Rne/Rng family ribonuclease [Micromonosporaceae bacterium]
MLDNEPEGGEQAGVQPPADAPATPARRGRATRRRPTSPVEPELPGTASPADPLTEAAPAEVAAPIAADTDSPPKTPRRRRKAAPAPAENPVGQPADPAAGQPGGAATDPAGAAAAGRPAAADTPAGEPGPERPVKATRTRRRKAAVVEPQAAGGGATPEPQGGQGGPAPEPSGAVPATAGETPDVGGDVPTPFEEEPATRRRASALSAPTVLFMPPEQETAARPVHEAPTDEPTAEPTADTSEGGRRRRRGRRGTEPAEPETQPAAEIEPVVVAQPTGPDTADEADVDEDDTEESAEDRRRRRRGRRGRGRGRGTAEEIAEEAEAPVEEAEPDEGEEAADELTRRRRRRRRRGAADTEAETSEDGVPTVVRIREPRRAVDEVQGVSGSTRLEAKWQRRRDGREQRRTRPPILSEAEFLARREAVDRVMAVRQRGDRTQIAVLEDGVLVEHYVTRNTTGTMVGSVYLGKVQNVLPSMEAAFVDVGRGRNAVLYAGEVNWDSTGLEGRARSIEQALKSGDSVLVQVTKDPIGHKGARLTSHVALSGRHLVYVPHGNASGISRKLPDNERKRLRDILKNLVPDGAGVIVRTAAEGASEDELARDVKRLQAQWEDIQAKAGEGGAPVLLYEEPDLVIRVVRDLFNEDFRELLVQGEEAYEMVESYLGHVSPDLVSRLRRHTGTADLFATMRIDEQILKGLDRKVYLPSGGSLVIDRTEAMTVIDVNTGKYTGAGGNLEETVTRNNLEAAEEIVRQLRLRDLGGIIVIDFIDMVLESNRELVLRRLTECLGRDRTKHQVTEITSLGLVQMTRKRIGAGLLDAFSETCDCCKGRGLIIHPEPVPEKPRASAAGEKVKAVAAAAEPAAGRRRGRRGAGIESVAEAAAEPAQSAPTAVEAEVVDQYDTMGYDLSRYETDASTVTEPEEQSEGWTRLAGDGDPDAVEGEESDGGDDVVAGGRRRSRRGGSRRRTRP